MNPVYDEIYFVNEDLFRINWNKKVTNLETNDIRREIVYRMFIQSCDPYDVRFNKELFASRKVPIFQKKEGRGFISINSIPWPVYHRFLQLLRSTVRCRLMFTSKKLFKDINTIHGFCVRDLNLRSAHPPLQLQSCPPQLLRIPQEPQVSEPLATQPVEYMSGLRNWSFVTTPERDPTSFHDFGNTKVFGKLKIDRDIDLSPGLVNIQQSLKAYYSLEMTVNSRNVNVLTKFIHTGVVNARIYLNSTQFGDLNTLFRVLYYVRNLQ